MTEEITKLMDDVNNRIEASTKQIEQLSRLFDEASVNHQRLLGERAGYVKMLEALNNTTKEGDTNDG